MRRVVCCAALLLMLASLRMMSAQAPSPGRPGPPAPQGAGPLSTPAPAAPARRPPVTTAAPGTFEKYCFECHGTAKPEADLSIERLITQSAQSSVGVYWQDWERVVDMLESGKMPPLDAPDFPTDAERAAAAAWIRSSLKAYETAHAGDPGTRHGPPADERRVPLRRAGSDRHRHQGRDSTRRATRSAARDSRTSATSSSSRTRTSSAISKPPSSSPITPSSAPARSTSPPIPARPASRSPRSTASTSSTRRKASASSPAKAGVRSGSSATARRSTSRGTTSIAWRSAIRRRRSVDSRRRKASPAGSPITSGMSSTGRRRATPRATPSSPGRTCRRPPRTSVPRSRKARAGCDEIYKALTTWPSWFFARGDLAAGGAGDESPLTFDDSTLKVEPSRRFTYGLGTRGGPRARRTGHAGSVEGVSDVHQPQSAAGVTPVVIWRNPRVVTRAAPGPGRGAPGAGATAAATPPASGPRSRRTGALDAVASIGAARRRGRDAELRHEPGRHGDRTGRFRDDRHGVVRRLTCRPAATRWSFRPRPSSARTRTPSCAS